MGNFCEDAKICLEINVTWQLESLRKVLCKRPHFLLPTQGHISSNILSSVSSIFLHSDGSFHHYTNMLLFFSWYVKILSTPHLHNLYPHFSAPFWKRSSQSITYVWFPSIFVFSFSLKLPPVRVLLPPPHWATLVKIAKDLHIDRFSRQFHAPRWNTFFTWLWGHHFLWVFLLCHWIHFLSLLLGCPHLFHNVLTVVP